MKFQRPAALAAAILFALSAQAQPPSVENYSWRNTWYAAVGGDYYVNDKLTLRAGVSVDTTPTYAATRSPRACSSGVTLLDCHAGLA